MSVALPPIRSGHSTTKSKHFKQNRILLLQKRKSFDGILLEDTADDGLSTNILIPADRRPQTICKETQTPPKKVGQGLACLPKLKIVKQNKQAHIEEKPSLVKTSLEFCPRSTAKRQLQSG